jgi:conjugal transfer pilus assembly protein TraD
MSALKDYVSSIGGKSQDKVVLGRVSGSIWRKEELTEGQLNHHVHIVGASGFGKTVLLMHLIQQRISQNKGLLFIDLKGDRETLMKITQFAAASNRLEDLELFSMSDIKFSHPYNLLNGGSPTQLRDRIMCSLNWSEEYYKNQASSFLLKLMLVLCYLRDQQNLRFHIGDILQATNSPAKILELAKLIPQDQLKIKSYAQAIKDFLDSKEHFNSLQGLRTQLESLVLADFGELIASEKEYINLFESYQKSKITVLLLDSRRYGETAKALGRFILQDLKSVSAKVDAELLVNQRRPYSIIIDEFADLAQEDFIGFLDRARSSKMSVVVAHQEICDLQRNSPEFAGRLMGNTSTLYAFLQKRSESAEIISGIAGTRKTKEQTMQMKGLGFLSQPTGMQSVKEVEEFVIHPNLIKSLRVGKCVCVKKYPEARAYLVDVSPLKQPDKRNVS